MHVEVRLPGGRCHLQSGLRKPDSIGQHGPDDFPQSPERGFSSISSLTLAQLIQPPSSDHREVHKPHRSPTNDATAPPTCAPRRPQLAVCRSYRLATPTAAPIVVAGCRAPVDSGCNETLAPAASVGGCYHNWKYPAAGRCCLTGIVAAAIPGNCLSAGFVGIDWDPRSSAHRSTQSVDLRLSPAAATAPWDTSCRLTALLDRRSGGSAH